MTEVTRFPEANKAYARARASVADARPSQISKASSSKASSSKASSSKASQAESRTREP